MSAIFISYRREDAEGQAGRLFTDLARHFGEPSVFMDVAGIEPGRDFRKAIDESVASCSVLLAVMGKGWLDTKDESGRRRLDDPHDFVRLETASALRRDIPVVPVLVQGARMPTAAQLPGELGDLAFRNAIELSHARWESDVALLIGAIERQLGPLAEPEPAQAFRAATSGAATSGAATSGAGNGRFGLAAILLAIAVAAVGSAALLKNGEPPRESTSALPLAPDPVKPTPEPIKPPPDPVTPDPAKPATDLGKQKESPAASKPTPAPDPDPPKPKPAPTKPKPTPSHAAPDPPATNPPHDSSPMLSKPPHERQPLAPRLAGSWSWGQPCAEGPKVRMVQGRLVFGTGESAFVHEILSDDGTTLKTRVVTPPDHTGDLYEFRLSGNRLNLFELKTGERNEWRRCRERTSGVIKLE